MTLDFGAVVDGVDAGLLGLQLTCGTDEESTSTARVSWSSAGSVDPTAGVSAFATAPGTHRYVIPLDGYPTYLLSARDTLDLSVPESCRLQGEPELRQRDYLSAAPR